MGKAIGIILAAIVIIGAGVYFMNRTPGVDDTSNVSTTSTTPTTPAQNVAQGRAVFSVTDAAVGLSTLSEINMEVSGVELHSAANGWALISSTTHTYNLLALNAKSQSEILADLQVPAGTYDQVRLNVNSVIVKTKAGVTKTAKLPSGTLMLNTKFVVNPNQTSSINFDFMADKSLHTTGKGEYIFAPVVKTQTKSNADVTVKADNTVVVIGGTNDDTSNAGMDIDGNVKANFMLNAAQKLDIVGDTISIPGLLNANTNAGANVPIKVSIDIKNSAFSPSISTIKTGTRITWTNNDTVSHTVTSDSGTLLNSGTIAPGKSFSFTFNNSGTVNYHCSIHPMMKGTIIVQ